VPDSLSRVRCVIAGGGPAGMMLALLLARAGVRVHVLEKHADFLRDFRGDTVHPSTLQLMHELGLQQSFLARPHDKALDVKATIGGEEVSVAEFARIATSARPGFIAMVPQWEFLDFLRDEAERFPCFSLELRAEAFEVIEEGGRIAGIRYSTPEGRRELRADLVVGADGRRSDVRRSAGLAVRDLGAPIDVLWMRVGKRPGDPQGSGGRIEAGRFLAMIDRGTYWQCAFVIRKGGIEAIRARGLPAFRADLAVVAPLFAGRLDPEIRSWDDVKLLSVSVDRLERWSRPGLLCIGDAAHAMSPIGGVGINLAVQDAVAAANLLAAALADPAVTHAQIDALLPKVQARRLFPARVTQALQVAIQNRLLGPVLEGAGPPRLPRLLRLMNRFPALRALPAYALGVGVRPEHIRSPLRTSGPPATAG
jgi:2-polyprenyl-6-methoxyphenol hydroxylase-like FAD-dependent oxidoreductase